MQTATEAVLLLPSDSLVSGKWEQAAEGQIGCNLFQASVAVHIQECGEGEAELSGREDGSGGSGRGNASAFYPLVSSECGLTLSLSQGLN